MSCPSRPAAFFAASDGEGFFGYFEAMARKELRLDPTLLEGAATRVR